MTLKLAQALSRQMHKDNTNKNTNRQTRYGLNFSAL